MKRTIFIFSVCLALLFVGLGDDAVAQSYNDSFKRELSDLADNSVPSNYNNAPSMAGERAEFPPPDNDIGSGGIFPPPDNDTGGNNGGFPPPDNDNGGNNGGFPPPDNDTGSGNGSFPPPDNEIAPIPIGTIPLMIMATIYAVVITIRKKEKK